MGRRYDLSIWKYLSLMDALAATKISVSASSSMKKLLPASQIWRLYLGLVPGGPGATHRITPLAIWDHVQLTNFELGCLPTLNQKPNVQRYRCLQQRVAYAEHHFYRLRFFSPFLCVQPLKFQ